MNDEALLLLLMILIELRGHEKEPNTERRTLNAEHRTPNCHDLAM